MGAMGWRSLLSCDRMLRTPVGKRWFDSKHPLSVIPLWPEVCIKYSWFNSVKTCSTLTTWALLTVAANPSCVSGFGRLLASCFEIVGPVSLMVDLEPMEKRGKELPAGYALLRRLKAKLGTGFVDLILGDGLYLNAPFFNLCLGEMKSDVLVKTDEYRPSHYTRCGGAVPS